MIGANGIQSCIQFDDGVKKVLARFQDIGLKVLFFDFIIQQVLVKSLHSAHDVEKQKVSFRAGIFLAGKRPEVAFFGFCKRIDQGEQRVRSLFHWRIDFYG